MEENMKEVFSADKMYKINIIKELLAENNIESIVMNKKGSAFLVGSIYLYVNTENEKEALSIIEKHNI